MPTVIFPLVIELALIGVLAFLFWLIVGRVIARERAERKSPFTKTLLKNPGESCLRKLDELDDKFVEWRTMILVGFGIIVGFAFGIFVPQFKTPFLLSSFGVAALAGVIFAMVRIRQNMRERLNYRLGFDGERHTAQTLMPLLGEGYELFHDLEFKDATGKPFNIDHVLLGPAGVIVVETKTRSKEAAGKGPDATTVRYDGKQIRYPKGPETHGLGQALANAKHLSRELTAHTGEKVFVRAALSLPGWFVIRTCKEEVNPVVHNPEMLRSWVQSLPADHMVAAQKNRIRGFLAKRDYIVA